VLPLILECRAAVTNAVPGYLPSVVPKIVNSLMRITGQTTAKQRTACTRRMCADVARYASSVHRRTFHPNEPSNGRFALLSGDEEALCIAIGRGDRALTRRILRAGVSLYGSTFLFDDVLSFAVKTCPKGRLSTLLADSGAAPDNRTRGVQKRMINARIDRFLVSYRHQLDVPKVIELLTWYSINPGASPFKSSVDWITHTFYIDQAPMVEFSDAIFALNPPSTIGKQYRDKFLAQWHPTAMKLEKSVAMIPILLREKVFEADDVDTVSSRAEAKCPSLLDVAVATGHLATVTSVLDLGANPDGVLVPSYDRLSYPLRAAISAKNVPIALLLLDYGADTGG
jgi:hypothetical protein